MNGVVIQMSLGDTAGIDSGRKTGNFGFGVSPAAASFARSIRVSSWSEMINNVLVKTRR